MANAATKMKGNMAKLNTKLIRSTFHRLSGEKGVRAFMRFMEWKSPSQADRIYNGKGLADIETIEQLAFKLDLSPVDLMIPSLGKSWPAPQKK